MNANSAHRNCRILSTLHAVNSALCLFLVRRTLLSLSQSCLTIISPARSGEWHALQIDSADYTTISLAKASPSILLGNLTFVASIGAGAALDEVSTLSLGSSHVLLAGVTSGASPELALLLWDLQYGVLLASRTLTIPASLNRSKKRGIDVQLASASGRTQQALLILGAKPAVGAANGSSAREDGTSNDVTQRSCILMVPYTVPATSTVANALGRAAAGEKWLNKTASIEKSSRSNLDSEQAKCIKAIHAGLEQKRVTRPTKHSLRGPSMWIPKLLRPPNLLLPKSRIAMSS